MPFNLPDVTRVLFNDVVLVCTTIVAVWKLQPPIKRWWIAQRTRKEILDSLSSAISKIAEDVKIIRNEVQFNGGSSLKDVVRENGYRVGLEIASRRLTTEHATWEGRCRTPDSEAEPEFVSMAWTKLTGMGSSDTADGGWAQCVAPEDRARVVQLAQASSQEQRLFHTEYTVVNIATGQRTRVSHIGRPLFDATGTLYGWVGLMTPIEEEKK